jgi:hypothetical protein
MVIVPQMVVFPRAHTLKMNHFPYISAKSRNFGIA